MDSEIEEEPEFVDFCMSRPSLALDWPQRRTFFFAPPSEEASSVEEPHAAREATAAEATLPLRKLRREMTFVMLEPFVLRSPIGLRVSLS